MKRVDSPGRRFPYLSEQHHYYAGAGPGGDDEATDVANNALWLPNWDIRLTDNDLKATYLALPQFCPKCKTRDQFYRHGIYEVPYRDIPAFGRRLIIKAQVQRFHCRACDQTSMQSLPDMDTKRQMTKRLVDYVGVEGIRRTFADVAREVGINEKTVRQICVAKFGVWLRQHQDNMRYVTPTILGIDEVNLLGQKRTVIVDIGAKLLLDMLPSMHLPVVEQWLAALPRKDKVQIVTMDMWGPYRTAVIAVMPKAKIVIDKFHVQRMIQEALLAIRKQAKEAAENGFGEKPKFAKVLTEKSRHRLNPAQRTRLDRLLHKFPLLAAGWDTKEQFYDIWDTKNRAEAERRFDVWRQSIPEMVEEPFREVERTILRRREDIFNYFDYPFTNAYTEGGRNRVIKDLSRAGRGYSFDIIRAKAILWEKQAGPTVICEACLKPHSDYDVRATYVAAEGDQATATKWLCEPCRRGKFGDAAVDAEATDVPF